MKKLILLEILLFSVCLLNAQHIELSSTVENKKLAYGVVTMLYDEKEGVYVLREKTLGGGKNFSIEKYNTKKLSLEYINVVDQKEDKYIHPIKFYSFNGEVYLLLSEQDNSDNYQYFLYLIANDGNLTNKIQLTEPGKQNWCPQIFTTSNNQQPYIFYSWTHHKSKRTHQFIYLDSTFHPVKKNEIDVDATDWPVVQNVQYGEATNKTTYFLFKMDYSSNDFGGTGKKYDPYLLYKVTASGQLEEIKIIVDVESTLTGAKIYTSKDGNVWLFGTCMKKGSDDILKGFFIYKINEDVPKIENIKLLPFDNNFLVKPYKYKTVNKVYIENIFETEQGNFTILFKKSAQNMNVSNISSNPGELIETTYSESEAGDCGINIINIEDETIKWSKSIAANKDIQSPRYSYNRASVVFDKDNCILIIPGTDGNYQNDFCAYFKFDIKTGEQKIINVTNEQKWQYGIALCNYKKSVCDSDGNCYSPWKVKNEIRLVKFVTH